MSEVLAVIYLLFNEGYLSSTGERAQSRDLVEDADWLTSLLAGLMPREPEIIGLLALIRLHRARAARFDDRGQIVLLRDQDRSTWDHAAIADAIQLLTRAAGHRRPGPYQLQAAIVACHAEARQWEDTDWPQIVVLYDVLLRHAPSRSPSCAAPSLCTTLPVRRPHWAELDRLADALDCYHLYHATHAELLRSLNDPEAAREADRRALALTVNPAEQAILEQRLNV